MEGGLEREGELAGRPPSHANLRGILYGFRAGVDEEGCVELLGRDGHEFLEEVDVLLDDEVLAGILERGAGGLLREEGAELRVVVTEGVGGNLGREVEEGVAFDVGAVAALALAGEDEGVGGGPAAVELLDAFEELHGLGAG